MNEDGFRAAVAAGVIGADDAYRSLLRSIVEVARAIFNAQRSSIFLLDEEADELVFEALAGDDEQELIGTRIPSSTGIAGWTLVTRQPLVIEDLTQDPRHARAVAERTGYVPKGIMSVPLLADERALGVLQVLDRPQRPGFSLQEMELLGLFANQAAIALDLLQRSRRAKSALETGGGDVAVVARVAAALDELTEGDRAKAVRLFEAIEDVLIRERPRR
jgi:GAF domain-containing protein